MDNRQNFRLSGFSKKKDRQNLLSKVQINASTLSLTEQVDLLSWLSDTVQEQVKEQKILKKSVESHKNLHICVILEQENNAESSQYTGNLVLHLQLQPDLITIATIALLPGAIADVDLLIFDISSADSPSIPLIEEISFEGDIVVFAPADLPTDVMANLSNRVTEVVVKPIDWQELKNKEYFK